jgi:co-chaperonin GroES (HSP10)
MSVIQATNNFVFIVPDDTVLEKAGLIMPEGSQPKPHKGVILSVGDLVQDKTIQPDKSALWHQGASMEVEYEGVIYHVIEGDRIIAVV